VVVKYVQLGASQGAHVVAIAAAHYPTCAQGCHHSCTAEGTAAEGVDGVLAPMIAKAVICSSCAQLLGQSMLTTTPEG
jgi:hypothetical protein